MANNRDASPQWAVPRTSEVIWQDAQHQVLFGILDEISTSGAGNAVFQRLKDYSENHFSLEERYMVELDYPDRDAHVRAHDRFRFEVVQLLDSGQPDRASREIIATFLTEWLNRHIFGTDRKLEEFILKSHAK
jgi:hemerythrin